MSFKYDPSQYETVKQRKARFYADHPDGRISCEIINQDLEDKAVVLAKVFINREDQLHGLPKGVGHALEIRDKELSKTQYGKEYESVNYTSWTENAEESAVGRALDNAGYASNAKCSRDEMEKAVRNAQAASKQIQANLIKPKPPTQAAQESESVPLTYTTGGVAPKWKPKPEPSPLMNQIPPPSDEDVPWFDPLPMPPSNSGGVRASNNPIKPKTS